MCEIEFFSLEMLGIVWAIFGCTVIGSGFGYLRGKED